MESLAYIQAWLIWEKQEEQLEVPPIQISSIPGLVILILLLAPLTDLNPVFAAQLLVRGSRGQDVVALQNDLKQAGCFPRGVRSTGYYGKITKAAVKKIQQTHGLRVDGVVGEQTRNAVDSGKTCQSLARSGVLNIGSRGERVSQLQVQLNNWGFPVKKVDGVFGKETRAAVIRFQESQGLKPDGIAGRKTAKVLWTPRTQISQVNTLQPSPEKKTYEKPSQELLWALGDASIKVNESIDPDEVLISAIINENLEKKIRYMSAVALARTIYENNIVNIEKKNLQKYCKPWSCLEKSEIYTIDSITIQEGNRILKKEVPVDSMVLLLNEAINQQDDLVVRFMAASAMPYLRQAPTENTISILKEELETFSVYNLVKPEAKEINRINGETNAVTSDTGFKSEIIEQAVESLYLFSAYASDSSSFKNLVPVLDKYMRQENDRENYSLYAASLYAANTLGHIAAMGNHEALTKIIDFLKAAKDWKVSDIEPLKIAAINSTIGEKIYKENPDVVKRIKDVFISSDDYDLSSEVTATLILVGEEKFVVDFLDDESLSEEKKLAVAVAIYKYAQNDTHKRKGLEAIIDLYIKNPKEVNMDRNTTRCILYKIGKPSIKPLQKVSQETPGLRDDVAQVVEAINNSDPSKYYPVLCTSTGGDPGWWATGLISHFGGGKK